MRRRFKHEKGAFEVAAAPHTRRSGLGRSPGVLQAPPTVPLPLRSAYAAPCLGSASSGSRETETFRGNFCKKEAEAGSAAASGQSTRWTGQAKQALVRLRIDRGAPACGVAAQNAGTQPLRVQSGGLRRPGRRHRTCPLHPRRAARAHCRTGTCAAVAARRRSRAAAWECEDGVRRRRLQAR